MVTILPKPTLHGIPTGCNSPSTSPAQLHTPGPPFRNCSSSSPPSSSSAQHIGSMCSSCHMFAAQQRKGAPRSAESTHETLQRTLTLPSPTARVILSLSIIQCIKLENSKQLQKEDLLAAQQFKWPAPPYSMCSYGDIRKKSVSIATKIGSEP